MEMQLQKKRNVPMIVNGICFAIFGTLAFWTDKNQISLINIVFGLVAGFIYAFITLNLMAFLIKNANGELRLKYGDAFARNAVTRGMLFMIPFTVLSVLAIYVLHWKMASLFISSAIMTSGAAVGTELGKLGKPLTRNFILPSITAFFVSTGWMYAMGPMQELLGMIKKLLGA